MNILRKLSLSSVLLVILSLPAFAGVIVYGPANGADVSASFPVSAFANWSKDRCFRSISARDADTRCLAYVLSRPL